MLHHPATIVLNSRGRRSSAVASHTLMGNQGAFWAVAGALGVTILGNNIPAPLYPLYQRAWHFSPGIATVIFAIVAVGVVPSLLLFGTLSDRLGRRPILLIGLALASAATVVFIFAQGVGWLMVARLLQGCAFGAMMGSATAALTELEPAHNASRALLVATSVTVASQAIGPLLTGLLAQYAPWPLRLVYILLLVGLVAALVAVWRVPESHTPQRTTSPAVVRFGVPANIRMPFLLAALAVLTAFGTVGIIAATGPLLAKSVLQLTNAALGGIVVFLFLGASAVAQRLNRARPYRALLLVGPPLLVCGLLSLALALARASVPLFLLATLVAGVGQGMTYLGSQEVVGAVATPDVRGSVFSVFNVVVYLGASATALGVGFGATALGLARATQVVLFVTALVATLAWILAAWTSGLQPSWFAPLPPAAASTAPQKGTLAK